MITYATCPACKTRLKVPEELAGQKRLAKCPSCAKTFDLSNSDEPRTARKQARADDEEVIDDLETLEDDGEPDDEPRTRKRQPRYEDDDDDRPVRRKRRRFKQAGGSNMWLIIGVAGGVALLLLIGCGIGAYALFSGVKGGLTGLVDNPNVTKANFDRIEMGTPLQAVEGMVGPGARCTDQEARDIILSLGAGMPGMAQDQQIANNPGAFGLTGWYRWKNGPTTMLVAVDGANTVRVAALYTVTKGSNSRNWKSNVNVGGGGFPPPGRPGRGK
jgi:predicted Zn finger-like uncharacterized protein